MKRCKWCNESNPLYVKYHDEEWGVKRFDDEYLFEMLLLEGFQAGLSWECVLNKRESFRLAFDGFDRGAIACYDAARLGELAENKAIIRNKRKILAASVNARIYGDIVSELGSFLNYLRTFWNGEPIFDSKSVTSPLSDAISKDLSSRGMKFVGSTMIHSYLQAIGIVNAHEEDCFLS